MSERVWGYDGYVPAEEGRREALCTLGNGVFATRGAAPESPADGVHYPGTYASGVFNRLTSEVGDGLEAHESMVNLPNWLPLTHKPEDGEWFTLDTVDIHAFRQTLDLEAGVLHRHIRFAAADGRITRVDERRLVSMAQPRLAALEQTIEPEDWSGSVTVRSTIDGTVVNGGTAEDERLANRHMRVTDTGADVGGGRRGMVAWLNAETVQSHRRIGMASRTTAHVDGAPSGASEPPTENPRTVEAPGIIGVEIDARVAPGQPVRVEKLVGLSTSEDLAISEPGEAALAELDDVDGFDDLLGQHRLAWSHLWKRCHLSSRTVEARHGAEITPLSNEGRHTPGAVLDLHLFHLLQTLSPNIADRDVGVPARGLHGEAYRGHIFWDELFIFPYLNLRFPQLTKELLLYRWRRLPAARRQAAELRCRGARFPWQSGSDGTEQTPTQLYNPRSNRWMPDHSQQQHHVGLAVAWNVWQYWQVTGDIRFLTEHGAELLVEIARFFADYASFDPSDHRWHLRGLMGPDEYHDGYPGRPGSGIDDNAYTSVLVAWLFSRALDMRTVLSGYHCQELWERLDLQEDELQRWDELRHRLAVPFLPDGIVAQFAGWGDLAELDWDAYRDRYGNIGRLDLILESEGDNTNNYKLTKQADALMLLYLFSTEELVELFGLLGYDFDPKSIPGMIDYYLARTADGSTLSHVAHSWVLARADRARSWPLLLDALQSDVADIQEGTTREGIHLGAMAGTVDIVQRAYSGLEVRGDTLRLNPHLPDELDHLQFDITYREHWLYVYMDHDRIRVASRPCVATPVSVGLAGSVVDLSPGEETEVALEG
jgi:trehalose/maltose hydrolase-like predicted phosphorylase